MGFPVAAAVAAGASLLSSGGSAYAQGKMNKKTREWNEKMHALTRQESLSDWALQNEYNSPAAQMQRFRDAGLNPNLIYGQQNEGATVRSADTPAWNPRAPNIDINAGPAISAFYDTRLKEAQTDNLRAAITTQQSEQLLKAAQTAQTIQNTKRSSFDLEQATNLSSSVLEAARINVEKLAAETSNISASTDKTKADTFVNLSNNERQEALTASSLREAVERITNLRLAAVETQARTAKTEQERENLKVTQQELQKHLRSLDQDSELKELELKLRRVGTNSNDPAWQRALIQNIDKIPKLKEVKNRVKSVFENFKEYRGKPYN